MPTPGLTIPLMFLCEPEKIRCSADKIPLFDRAAEFSERFVISMAYWY
jgi:hypothetical protein